MEHVSTIATDGLTGLYVKMVSLNHVWAIATGNLVELYADMVSLEHVGMVTTNSFTEKAVCIQNGPYFPHRVIICNLWYSLDIH